MPRNFSELKSGGTSRCKVGERVPPVPHRSTPVLEPIKISTQGCKLIEPGNGAVRHDGCLLKKDQVARCGQPSNLSSRFSNGCMVGTSYREFIV